MYHPEITLEITMVVSERHGHLSCMNLGQPCEGERVQPQLRERMRPNSSNDAKFERSLKEGGGGSRGEGGAGLGAVRQAAAAARPAGAQVPAAG